jgi:hypothetical protein
MKNHVHGVLSPAAIRAAVMQGDIDPNFINQLSDEIASGSAIQMGNPWGFGSPHHSHHHGQPYNPYGFNPVTIGDAGGMQQIDDYTSSLDFVGDVYNALASDPATDEIIITGDNISGLLDGDPKTGIIKAAENKFKTLPVNKQRVFRNKVLSAAATPAGLGSGAIFRAALIDNGTAVITPTKTSMRGQAINLVFQRVLSQYVGSSRTATQVSTGVPLTFTFAAPVGDEISRAFPILIELTSSKLNNAQGSLIQFGMTGVNEEGAALAIGTWTFRINSQAEGVTTILFLPYLLANTELYPQIVQADGVNNLVITLVGVPTNYIANVNLLNPNDERLYAAMVKLGFKNTARIQLPQ